MQVTTERVYDLSFVGAGLSCSFSLIHLLNAIETTDKRNCFHLLIIDKAHEFWTGIPYGARSGSNSLIITSLKEFLPPAELALFVSWLKENYRRPANENAGKGFGSVSAWIARNKEAILHNQWEKIFIPRYLFGIYLSERIKAVLDAAVSKGRLNYMLVAAETTNVERLGSAFKITVRDGEKPCVYMSKRVVLSIGSPPKTFLNNLGEHVSSQGFIEDMYEPGLLYNMERINRCLHSSIAPEKKNVLVLGSNASALEIFFNLYTAADLETINKFYVISPVGAFPSRIEEDKVITDYSPANLAWLKSQETCTSAQILEAVKNDTLIAHNENLSISAIYQAMSAAIIELLNRLSEEEQKKFVCNDGVEIGKFQRRAGGEYLDVIKELLHSGKIEFIKGRYIRLVDAKEDQFTLEYYDSDDRRNKVFPVSPNLIINCIGFQDLVHSSSELIQNLVRQNICTVNGSGRGFVVNEDFESSRNFFVMGPLLAGNLNGKIRVWHAESCPRIFSLSQQLADVLIQKIHAAQNCAVEPQVAFEQER